MSQQKAEITVLEGEYAEATTFRWARGCLYVAVCRDDMRDMCKYWEKRFRDDDKNMVKKVTRRLCLSLLDLLQLEEAKTALRDRADLFLTVRRKEQGMSLPRWTPSSCEARVLYALEKPRPPARPSRWRRSLMR